MRATDRRTFVRTLLAGAAGLSFTSRLTFAQAPPIGVTRLDDSLVLLSGDGGNVGLLLGDDGLTMIDGGLATRAAELADAIADIDGRRVRVLVNTHYHFDHVGSNEFLGRQASPGRVRIVAHQNVAARLGQRLNNEAFGRTFEPLESEGLPTETFTREGRLVSGGVSVEYTHVPLAHTDGDAYVFMPSLNVLQTGDLFWLGRYPVVDYSTGGSLGGMISALDQLMNVGDAATRIIPGHGPLAGKDELKATRETWSTINGRIEAMVRAGRTLDEVMAAAPTREFDASMGVATRDSFVRQVYGGLVARERV